MKILVLGASGMIGNAMLRVLSEKRDWTVVGTVRSASDTACFPADVAAKMVAGLDVSGETELLRLFHDQRPDVVINCIGVTKHLPAGNHPLTAIALNALLPQRLAALCGIVGARLIHISTDCVFSGSRGNYAEDDLPDSPELYGRSKVLGEVAGPGLLTLRTSTIGHELHTKHGLLEWFLSQSRCKGYTRAVFSGLPSVVFAGVLRDVVIPAANLSGLYHVAAAPIAKADLLQMIAATYGAAIEIQPDDDFVIDRSLDSSRFTATTGYLAPNWPEMIAAMHEHHRKDSHSHV